MLKGKHIIVGITGGIAAFKIATLVRLLIKRGAEVQVVMTPNAKEFITPVTLSALTGKPVVSEFFTANTGEWHSHVDLGLWADALVIAPATASTIGKMANGIADNMLVTTYLSAKAPVFIAPAMDLDMMAHPSTVRNIELLRSYGNHIIEPAEGELASHLIGKGRMEEPENIVKVLEEFFSSSRPLSGKKVLVTAGPTYERIDPVRFIGNFSTGKMGYALADAAARAGAEVTVISGPVSVSPSERSVKVIGVESACQMAKECERLFPETDIAIMCAAVADYAPAEFHETKIKRESRDTVTLELKRNPDIAATLGSMKKMNQKLVGFALETDHEDENALKKLHSKNLDMIVLNSLAVPGAGFATDTNKVTVFEADSSKIELPLMSKKDTAENIIRLLS
ncbi:MAG: bifunctional phosphopantothenoylcysteine decarboxylase/phosphopantothenate--cysteine ligase CoaBC [Muribaculaceae bacterium]|nr:bifunctional phosphopantothenoylcysteine decarboxylase/phosphopantothenate--cysteine ligase CoaBC [Muribaculaceae bacterium]